MVLIAKARPRWLVVIFGVVGFALVGWLLLRPSHWGHWVLDAYQIESREYAVEDELPRLDKQPYLDFGLASEWSDGCDTLEFESVVLSEGLLHVSPAEFIDRDPCPDDNPWLGTEAMNETWIQAYVSGVRLEVEENYLTLTGNGVALFFVRSGR